MIPVGLRGGLPHLLYGSIMCMYLCPLAAGSLIPSPVTHVTIVFTSLRYLWSSSGSLFRVGVQGMAPTAGIQSAAMGLILSLRDQKVLDSDFY